MTSIVDAARTNQRRSTLQTVYRCDECEKALSIPEFLERFCEACAKDTRPVGAKEKVS
jgi:hypothetical protein